MGVRSSRRNQLDPQQDVIYQDLNHRVLISSGNQKPLPTATVPRTPQLASDVYVHRNSISLDPDPSNPSLLWLSFQFDSKVPCLITIYFYAVEILDAAWVTREYPSYSHACESPHTLPKRSMKFDMGMAQKFPEKTISLETLDVPEAVLVCKDRKTYPVVIEIVLITQKPLQTEHTHSLTSLVALQKEGEGWKARVVHQKFNSDLDSFYVEEIFGLTNTEENECVVCMTDRKDTSVLPCRHLCLCAKCAHTMRSQKQPKCPICRTSKPYPGVAKLLQIKDE